MIILLLGTQGSGKTLSLVRFAYRAHKYGKKIYSNFHLNFPHMILTFEQMLACEFNNAVVVVDEAQNFGFDSREAMKRGNIALQKKFISQIRKQDVTFWASFQRLNMADSRLRSQSEWYFDCKKFLYQDSKFIEIIQSKKYPKDAKIIIDINTLHLDTGKEGKIRFIANNYYDLYDTRQVIETQDIDGYFMEQDNDRKKKIKEKNKETAKIS